MRILLCNKFYYRRGGDCIYTLEVERLLKRHGHEIAVYAMQYPENENSEWSNYWPAQMHVWDLFTRPFGSRQVIKGFSRLIQDFKPDVVHLNNIHTQLSPVLAEIAHKNGIRVIWTLHDTKLICPCYTCMRDKHWCEACFTNPRAVVKYRCMPGHLPGAVIGYYEIKKWSRDKLQRYTDLFITPSRFMKEAMCKGGYATEKLHVLCNFIDVEKCKDPSFQKEDYYVYLGRINEIKGLRTLCNAASQLPYKLVVIGEGELLDELRTCYRDANIEFKGAMQWSEFRPILEHARFMVLPSEWSENNPLTIIEAQSLGTPVLGARIGGITELIEDEISGMTFTSGDIEDLKAKIIQMMHTDFQYELLARTAQKKYSAETYYDTLMKLYHK